MPDPPASVPFSFNATSIHDLLVSSLQHKPWTATYRNVASTWKLVAVDTNEAAQKSRAACIASGKNPQKGDDLPMNELSHTAAQAKVKSLIKMRKTGEKTRALHSEFSDKEQISFNSLIDNYIDALEKWEVNKNTAKDADEQKCLALEKQSEVLRRRAYTTLEQEQFARRGLNEDGNQFLESVTSDDSDNESGEDNLHAEVGHADTASLPRAAEGHATRTIRPSGPLHDPLSQLMSTFNQAKGRRHQQKQDLLSHGINLAHADQKELLEQSKLQTSALTRIAGALEQIADGSANASARSSIRDSVSPEIPPVLRHRLLPNLYHALVLHPLVQ
ncbi:hypothetical protein PENSPDRAFT_694497 [Peniophora sp. CONT]|nr:hypothetical protein PENSPDRAFT_694497 [Peniophora sp. CONT]